MDLKSKALEIESWLKENAVEYEVLGTVDDEGGAFGYTLSGGDAQGFVAVDSNVEDLQIPTVSVSVLLGELTEASREELLGLLTLNRSLLNASLAAVPLDETQVLMVIQTRVPVEVFEIGDLGELIESLLDQSSLFFDDEEEEGDGEG